MQNRLEHKKVCGKWTAQPGPAPAAEGLAPERTGPPSGATGAAPDGGPLSNAASAPGYCLASSVETSFSETELMQKRWSVGVP
ncbi:hypothetical protein J2W14_002578 [Pseudarthrobacter oxydans]|nr:hypothetical protein [Pseudarthrobacter oxydans]